jgi:hypothetical protein
MAIGANSYGTVAEVGVLTPLYATAAGTTYSTTTRPTLAQVEKFVDRVSGIVNVLLAEAGFAIPVTQTDAKLALDDFVVMEAAGLAEYANGAGPFIAGSEQMRAATPTRIIVRDAELFIEAHADGFEALGATRTRRLTYGLGCRTENADGESILPYFSREQMGNEVEDWTGEGD